MSYSGHSDQVVGLKIKIKIPDTKEKETHDRIRTGSWDQVGIFAFFNHRSEYSNFSVIASDLTNAND